MTATTFDDTMLDGAPRRTVEDAWRTLNTRYAIGTGVLLATLALLWALGMGPGASRSAAPVASTAASTATSPAQRSGDAPGGASREAAGTPAASATQAGQAAAADRPTPGTGGAAGTPSAAAAAGAASTGTAAASAAGANAPGAVPAALPRPLPGAPVARLYFEPDQSWPSGEVGPRLAPVLARLKAEPDAKVLVSGFHARRGSVERNAELAQRRAQAVRRVLIREGVAAERIVLAKPQQTQGSGPDREARRVEVTVAR